MRCPALEKRFRLFNAYVWGIAGLGIFLLATNIPKFQDGRHVAEVLFLAILVACGEAAAVPFPRGKGTASMATPLIFTVIVLHGPAVGMWVAALATLRKRDLSLEVPLNVVLFNRGMLTVCAYVFSKIYFLIYGGFGSLEFPRGCLHSYWPQQVLRFLMPLSLAKALPSR